jgi:hypothetical protein
MTLYRDPAVRFGGSEVGGIRVSHLSDIEKRIQVALTVTRGKRQPFIIEPLAPMSDQIAEFDTRIAEAQTVDDLDAIARELKAKGNQLGEHRAHLQTAWKARRDVLEAQPPTVEADLAVDELQLESQ